MSNSSLTNNYFLKLFYLLTFSFLFSQDVVLSLDGSSLNYESTADVAGFQFDHDGCASGASGGDAAAAGFMISASGSTVLGFSLTGSTIPAGAGTLLDLGSQDCTTSSLSNFIFSDSGGNALDVEFDNGGADIEGCTDIYGLNYNSDATVDDGSCEYGDHQIEAGSFYFSPSIDNFIDWF